MDLFIKMFRALKNGKNHYCHITTNHLFVHDPCEKVGGRYTERVTFPAQVHEDTLDTSHALHQNRTGEEPVTVIRSDRFKTMRYRLLFIPWRDFRFLKFFGRGGVLIYGRREDRKGCTELRVCIFQFAFYQERSVLTVQFTIFIL